MSKTRVTLKFNYSDGTSEDVTFDVPNGEGGGEPSNPSDVKDVAVIVANIRQDDLESFDLADKYRVIGLTIAGIEQYSGAQWVHESGKIKFAKGTKSGDIMTILIKEEINRG